MGERDRECERERERMREREGEREGEAIQLKTHKGLWACNPFLIDVSASTQHVCSPKTRMFVCMCLCMSASVYVCVCVG